MTWKASAGSPPWAAGLTSGSMMSRNSAIDPGQPWVMRSGSASGSVDRTWRKWTFWLSISGGELGKLVQGLLLDAPVIGRGPVLGEVFEVVQRDAQIPAHARQLVGPAGATQPFLEVIERALWDVDGVRGDFAVMGHGDTVNLI